MPELNNIFHTTKTNLSANEEFTIGLTEEQRRQIGNKPCNHLVAYSALDRDIFIQLNNDPNQRYPLLSNSGRTVINKEDQIFFHYIQLIEFSGNNATGTVYITYGAL